MLYQGGRNLLFTGRGELARSIPPEVRPLLTLISCPECDVPAEVTDRFALASTDGPVDHVALRCAAGHHFRMPADRLPAKSQQQLRAHEPDLSPDYASPLAGPKSRSGG
jgi:hypothetical protein